MAFEQIAVIGAGAWGCALANVITRAGRSVTLAARTRDGAAAIARQRTSPRLPGIALDPRIEVVATGSEHRRYDAILLAVPAQALRAAAQVLAPSIARGTPVVSCAKGLERGSCKFMTDVIAETLHKPQDSPPRSAPQPSVLIIRPISAASRSAGPPRMCLRLRPAS